MNKKRSMFANQAPLLVICQRKLLQRKGGLRDVDRSVTKESGFFKVYSSHEISESAKANIGGLAQNIWLRRAHISGPLHFYNLTTLSETRPVDGCRLFDHSHKARSEKFERALGSTREREVDIRPLKEEAQPELEADENMRTSEASEGLDDPEYEGESSQETVEVSKEHGTSESEEVLQALEAEVIEPDALEVQQTQEEVLAGNLGTQQKSDVNDEEQPIMGPKAEEIQSEVSGAAELQGEPATISFSEKESVKVDAKPESSELDASSENVPVSEAAELQGEPATISFSEKESAKVDEKPESSELDASAENVPVSEVEDQSTISSSKERSFRETELRITLLVLTCIAASVFIYVRKGKPTTTSTATKVEQPQLTKKLDFSPISANNENNSQNWQTEVDVVGESCPSEMSSFQRSSSYSSKKGLKGSSEAQNQERKPRKNNKRESLASSSEYSMGSPSYGSFTTYEKIPFKHGHIEEETITPVRRSSRIRKQVTSP
ncbi:hypothetical protein CJ030_MR7G007746 [Morella rubra]|uniref:Uncharacterized protein n=1 Tax=Morella rubra TaxID=262757 RepID=A0A6A1V710_9ROSI|nr:hypothetical protein CJ030_MR7G007746 [Morella rubra]